MKSAGRAEREPSLTMDQIILVYEESGRSIDPAVLTEVAHRMFPDHGVKFHSCEGGFRGYIDEDKEMRKPKYTIGTGPTLVAIMEDGSARPY